FVAKLAEKARGMVLGGPDVEDAQLGPMIHETHLERVLGYIEGAKADGAELVTGGGRADAAHLQAGNFVEPTIFAGVTPQMKIFNEEVFGPVLAVTTFKTLEEAVTLANRTVYGLANGVWTKNLDVAMEVSRRLESGFVY